MNSSPSSAAKVDVDDFVVRHDTFAARWISVEQIGINTAIGLKQIEMD